ncbi:hypothetical protein [Streptomyces sp. NPDC056452]|uniref:hypothetical protein n=1 Tax=Streptomyces sp. NPDC056452 TaxID=3345821 RepID=UPI00367D9B3F
MNARTTRHTPLPPRLSHALPLLGPGAGHWLPRLLEPVARSTREDRWHTSLLTPLRFPVEFSVASSSPHMTRYTTEFVSPDRAPATRLPAGLERLRELRLPGPDDQVAELLLRAHRCHTVVWGTWLGGRHDARRDRFKLYVEVPKAAAVPFERDLTAHLGTRPFPLQQGRLRLVGLDLTTGGVERYYRVGTMSVADLRGLVPEGSHGRAEALTAALVRLVGRPFVNELPGFNVNISLAGPSLTVSGPALSWLGTDRVARRRLLDFAAGSGLDLSRYAALTAACAEQHRNHHGILALTLPPGPGVQLTIGFSPFGPAAPIRNPADGADSPSTSSASSGESPS